MKYLLVGDVHAMANDLVDAQALLDYCKEIIKYEKVDVCFFSGDLFNYFNIVHLPVLKFWSDNLEELRQLCKVIALVGNHDFGAGNPDAHALIDFKNLNNVIIVDKPTIFDKKLFMPYYGGKRYQEFISACKEFSCDADMLFCHETYNGAQYENGFYAKDGLNPADIPQSKVYAGHIHKMAQVDKITYIGSPRWITISDANEDKFLWLEDFDTGTTKLYGTGKVCRVIKNLVSKETKPLSDDITIPAKDKITIDIHGSVNFVRMESEKWKQRGAVTRDFPEKNFTSEVRESEGIWPAFGKFVLNYKAKYGTPSEVLYKLSKDRLNF